jgi:hypothetical protein
MIEKKKGLFLLLSINRLACLWGLLVLTCLAFLVYVCQGRALDLSLLSFAQKKERTLGVGSLSKLQFETSMGFPPLPHCATPDITELETPRAKRK